MGTKAHSAAETAIGSGTATVLPIKQYVYTNATRILRKMTSHKWLVGMSIRVAIIYWVSGEGG